MGVEKIKMNTKFDPIVEEFCVYLKDVRGAVDGTIYNQSYQARRFIWLKVHAESLEFNTLKHKHILDYVDSQAKVVQRTTLQNILTSLRSFFRFLHLNGYCKKSLKDAVPSIPVWKRAKVPTYLTENQVNLLIKKSKEKTKHAIGKRNFACILLFCRLGLRSNEVANLKIEDIEWKYGVINLRNQKSRRVDRLPLPDDVGSALISYIQHGRPESKTSNIFVTHVGDAGRAINPKTVQGWVGYQMRSFGLELPSYGTHILRRTVASHLIQNGSSIKEISDALRHRDIDTSKIYSKVNIPMLKDCCLPWPEVMS